MLFAPGRSVVGFHPLTLTPLNGSRLAKIPEPPYRVRGNVRNGWEIVARIGGGRAPPKIAMMAEFEVSDVAEVFVSGRPR